MPITTGTGDDGSSSLLGGARLPKDHPRFEAYGTVDEAQCAIGMVLASGSLTPEIGALLQKILADLFTVGSDLATLDPEIEVPRVTSTMIQAIEAEIHKLESELPPLTHFIQPTGTLAATTCFWARAVVRRAERHVATLMQSGEEVEPVLIYLNRLGDLLFLVAKEAQ